MNASTEAFGRVFPGSEDRPWYPRKILLDNEDLDKEIGRALSEENLIEYAELAGIPNDWMSDLVLTSRIISSHKDLLSAYATTVQLLANEGNRYNAQLFKDWPDPKYIPEQNAPLFFLLVSLACIPEIRKTHKLLQIPESISRATCGGIGSKAEDYFFFNSRPGMKKRSMYWFQHFLSGELFRIGRLEFMVKQAEKSLHVFKNPINNETRLMTKSPINESWVSPENDLEHLKTVSPEFFSSWRQCLGPGDTVLDIHIPGGGGLTLELIHDSFVRAISFYSHFRPELRIKGFECQSWIISPDLEGAYSEESNLIKFRKKVHLFPVKSGKVEGLSFIFGTDSKNPHDWPEKTSVQRRLKQHLLNGGTFRMAGMIFLIEDLSSFMD